MSSSKNDIKKNKSKIKKSSSILLGSLLAVSPVIAGTSFADSNNSEKGLDAISKDNKVIAKNFEGSNNSDLITLGNFNLARSNKDFVSLYNAPTDNSTHNLIEADKVKVIQLTYANFLGFELKEGVNYKDCKFYVDGVKIEPSKVKDDGRVLKWEIVNFNHRELKVVSGNEEDTIVFNNAGTGGNFTPNKKTSARYIWAFGTVSVFDYHL